MSTQDKTYTEPKIPDPKEIRFVNEVPGSAVVDTRLAAAFLNVAPETLEVWRSTRRVNIPYYKLGRSVRYRIDDLRKFQAECRVELTNSDGGSH